MDRYGSFAKTTKTTKTRGVGCRNRKESLTGAVPLSRAKSLAKRRSLCDASLQVKSLDSFVATESSNVTHNESLNIIEIH